MSTGSAYNNNEGPMNKSNISNGQQVIAENKPTLRTQSVTHNIIYIATARLFMTDGRICDKNLS